MLSLLTLPIELLHLAFYIVQGVVDALRGRNRLRFAVEVAVNAPREAVWRFCSASRMLLDGPPPMEIVTEPIPDGDGLLLSRVSINGQLRAQGVARETERDEVKGVIRARSVAHQLAIPPEGGRDIETGLMITATPSGTALTMSYELTVRAFRDRIVYPIGVRRLASQIGRQCEKEAGASSRLTEFANHGLVLSAAALLSFCYLFGWKAGLLLAVVIVIHEAGHAAAMWVSGVGVRAIYLIPFFGGAAVPRTSYGSDARLGFVALMGPCLSVIPTLGLYALYRQTGSFNLAMAAEMFAFINVANLLPIYPLDGGLILNALIGSVSRRSALIAGWVGIIAGLGLAAYLQSFLIGIPFLLFGLQRYLTSGNITIELKRMTLADGIALTLASIATVAVYVVIIKSTMLLPGHRF
ncbi:hypothetical protein JQ604_00410 [Bradyrhizobium jicamae]|uniref:metalloprotease n=1 Tax=Bradyrhizobium jicamae TaxID=280332 RepID=UPI001BA8191A|nr:hypothetical protein [Bradyrhizobium jicamae]MBR0750639.1 hypothetical protein [Bradyrhizobium jicamae]